MVEPIDIRVAEFEDTLVVYFATESPRINAYTLATTLIGLADAAKAANASVNPGYEIEVLVEALAPGSFKATLRALYASASNLFSRNDVRNIVIAIVANFIYERFIAKSPDVTVIANTDEVIIVQGNTRILVPRQLHEETKRISTNPAFLDGIDAVVRAVELDSEVKSIGISPNPNDSKPPVEITREVIASFTRESVEPLASERIVEEITEVQILRAILERSPRLWQFAWHGVRISSPVSDDLFYDKFFRHQITIAPGDVLRVHLQIRQSRNADLGVYMNKSYEVVKVIDHVPSAEQLPLAEE